MKFSVKVIVKLNFLPKLFALWLFGVMLNVARGLIFCNIVLQDFILKKTNIQK